MDDHGCQQGGETGTRLIQHGQREELYTDLQAQGNMASIGKYDYFIPKETCRQKNLLLNMAHHFSCLSHSQTKLVGVVNWVSTNLQFSPPKSTFKQLRQFRQKSIIQPWSKSKSVNSANQGLGTSPILCVSEGAIQVITKMFFSLTCTIVQLDTTTKCVDLKAGAHGTGNTQCSVCLVVRWLQTLVKHEQWPLHTLVRPAKHLNCP